MQPSCPKHKEPLWTKDFIMITLLSFFLFTALQTFPAALPPYVKSLGASDSYIGWMQALATIATLVIRPITGLLLDSAGRKVILCVSLGFCTIVALIFFFFPILGVILVLRFLLGAGSGMSTTASNTAAADCIPHSRFGEGMGYFTMSSNVAMAMAPALALYLAPKPMIIMTVGFFIGAWFLSFKQNYPPLPKVENKSGKRPFPYEKASVFPAVIIMLSTCSFGAITCFLAIYAQSRGITQNIGTYFTVYAIVVLLTRPHTGKLVDRRGPRVLVLPALLFNITGLFIMSQATTFYMFLLSAAVFGFGQSATVTSTQAMAILNAPAHRKGAATATYYTGFDLGSGCGAMLAGYIATYTSYSYMFMFMTIMPAIALVLFTINSLLYKRS